MNRDIFLQMLLYASDVLTFENLCKTYPEFVPADNSPYWLKLMQDRFPEKKQVNLRKIYSEMIDHVIPIIQRLKDTYDYLVINLTELQKFPDAIEYLSSHVMAVFKDEHDLYINYFCSGFFIKNDCGTLAGHFHEETLREFLQKVPPHVSRWLKR